MGIDAGFDMAPRLSQCMPGRQNWQVFLDEVSEHYQYSPDVEFQADYVN